jgi:hypothetical protein
MILTLQICLGGMQGTELPRDVQRVQLVVWSQQLNLEHSHGKYLMFETKDPEKCSWNSSRDMGSVVMFWHPRDVASPIVRGWCTKWVGLNLWENDVPDECAWVCERTMYQMSALEFVRRWCTRWVCLCLWEDDVPDECAWVCERTMYQMSVLEFVRGWCTIWVCERMMYHMSVLEFVRGWCTRWVCLSLSSWGGIRIMSSF